jgi:hypothetical protein
MKSDTYSVLDQLVISGSFFAYNLLIISSVGISNYGLFSLLWMYYIFSIGIQNSVIIHSLQLSNEDEESTLFKLNLLFSLVYSVAIFFLNKFYFDLGYSDNTLYFFSIFILAQLNLEFLRRLYYKKNKENRSFYISFRLNIVRLSLFLFYGLDITINEYIFLLAISSLIISAFYTKLIFNLLTEVAAPYSKYMAYLSDSKWLFLTSVSQFFSGNYVIILSSTIIGMGAVGAVKGFQNLIGPIQVIFQIVESYFPRLAIQHIKKDYLTKRSPYAILLWVTMVLIFMICISIYIALPLIFDYFSLEQLKKLLIAENLIFLYFIFYLSMNLKMYLRLNNITRPLFFSEILSVLFSLFIAEYFLEFYGFNGLILSLYSVQVISIVALTIAYYFLKRVKNENINRNT